MIEQTFDTGRAIRYVRLDSSLGQNDFTSIAKIVDPDLEAPAFRDGDSFGAAG